MTSPTDDPATDVEQRCYRHPDDGRPGSGASAATGRSARDCMTAASVGFQCPECVAEGNATVRQAAHRSTAGGSARRGRPDVVTLTLIGINVAVFVATTCSGVNVFSGSGNSTLFNHLALIPPAVAHGQWYRLFTAAFLHFGIFHIGFNMYALYLIGPPLEAALGRLRYVALYLLAGVGGSILSVALGPLDRDRRPVRPARSSGCSARSTSSPGTATCRPAASWSRSSPT